MSVTLRYFPIYGRGEAIRIALKVAGVDVQDEVVTFEDWPNQKANQEFGRLPVLLIDGHELVET